MTKNNGKSAKRDSAKQRHAQFLKNHKARMRRVDDTLTAVKNRSGQAGRSQDKRAGA